MKIKWFGHAAFLLSTSDVNIIIDPYQSGAFQGAVNYAPITDRADIVLVSHNHDDHNDTSTIEGAFTKVDAECFYDLKGVKITAIPVYHDASKGKERGENLIFLIEAEGMKIVHAGDLGHLLDQDAVKRIGKTDVLMLPVGGTFTIDADEATEVMNTVKPFVTLPMHYKTPKMGLPLGPVEEFTQGKNNVRKVAGSEIDFTLRSLPRDAEIIVLQFAN
jgi:L-ascorbate metabolism protein UlaG (beta-lactamase superfamily)